MDLLARRDHSEKELRDKLAKHFSEDEIDPAIEEIKERGWLLPPEELSAKATESLHRKNKGYLYICHFLRTRGLPELPKDMDRELSKALEIIEQKGIEPTDIKRMSALLKNRGFDTETISRTIHEVRTNSQSLC